MHRRTFIQSAAALLATGASAPARAGAKVESMADVFATMRAYLPFELVTVPGKDALTAWERLRRERSEMPVVVGTDDDVIRLAEPFDPADPTPKEPLDEVIGAAGRIKIPEDLFVRREAKDAASRKALEALLAAPDARLPVIVEGTHEGQSYFMMMHQTGGDLPDFPKGSRRLSPAEVRARLSAQRTGPEEGTWPAEPQPSPGLSVAADVLSGEAHDQVHIALIPTKDWTTVPAHLRWGGWNDCPAAEVHVAALRSWRTRYGVELVGIRGDTMNLRAARRPKTRDEALELAREQYVYCTDIIDQGVDTYSALAASLMHDDWWYFWWD